MKKAKVDGSHEFLIDKSSDRYTINGEKKDFDIQKIDASSLHIIHNHKPYQVIILTHDPQENTIQVKVNGSIYEVQLQDDSDSFNEKSGTLKRQAVDISLLKAPMPGLIVEVKVQEGQVVEKNEAVIVLKAMKM